jgi:ribonuclease P protein component
MLKKADRLTTADITALSQGKSVFGTLLSLRFTPADRSKFAVSVSKKVASRAVDRNVIRRKVYDAIKTAQDGLKTSVFAMILPKKECLTADSESVRSEIEAVFKKAGLR